MVEHPLELDKVELSPQKNIVRVFYKELRDRGDKSLIPIIFHADFTFRGSPGPTLVGHDKFAEYVDWVTDAVQHYKTDILAMIEEGNRVSGKMRFYGVHGRIERYASPIGPVLEMRSQRRDVDVAKLGQHNGRLRAVPRQF
jgi:hypothetical protein